MALTDGIIYDRVSETAGLELYRWITDTKPIYGRFWNYLDTLSVQPTPLAPLVRGEYEEGHPPKSPLSGGNMKKGTPLNPTCQGGI